MSSRARGFQRAVLFAIAGGVAALPGRATLSGQIVLNEILAENGTWNPDDDGDFEDWVELYNAGQWELSLRGYALSDDAAKLRKWTLPEVKIAAGGYLLVWLSGKDRFVPRPGIPDPNGSSAAFRPNLVRLGEEWRYLIADPAAAGPPAGWKDPGFDDAAWPTGRSGFGYGDSDDATELPTDTGAVFARKAFRVEDPRSVESLVLRMNFDDGFSAFLNGVRVASEGAAPEEPTFQSTATIKREAVAPILYDLSPHLASLRAGENVLAIVGLNNVPSSDMSLLPELGTLPAFLHASFQLEKNGEELLLSDESGQEIDRVRFLRQTRDHSYGRTGGPGGAWSYFLVPTPELPNAGTQFDEPIADGVLFSPEAGRHPGSVSVSFALNLPGEGELRYTTDGSVPTLASPLYESPVTVTKNTVFRVAGFVRGERSTAIVSRSYFVDSSPALPVLSISMDPRDYETVHNSESARGRISERPAYLEVFERGFQRAATLGCGLRLHGGASRGGDFETKKSYRCYFRGEYGAKSLKYPLIPDTVVDSFDKIVLRAGFNDAFRTNSRAAYLRDQLVRDLHEEMGGIISHGTWCSLYVNMKLRGLYNAVERIDGEFLEPYTGDREWDIIRTGNEVLEGSIDEWEKLHELVVGNDLSQETSYREAENLIDIDSFTSYMLVNIWAQNHDWISNNWYAARPRRVDGKWIFLCWDAEFGIGLIPPGNSADTLEFIFTRAGYLRDILESLLESSIYRAYFAEEADRHAHGALLPSHVVERIGVLKNRIAPDIPEELSPYEQPVSRWLANVNECIDFSVNRQQHFLELVAGSTRYDFPPVTTPRITSCQPGKIFMTGGEKVTLTGVRFEETTEITFNGVPAARVERLSPTRLLVTPPFDLRLEGFTSIAAADPSSGSASRATGLLEVGFPRPQPVEVAPARGTSVGGDRVKISGAGFLPGVTVQFGETLSPDVTLTKGETPSIEAVTPPGMGVVSVRVMNHVPGGMVPARVLFAFSYVEQNFLRGDSNGDSRLDISDAVSFLERLFLGGAPFRCDDAADANDSGALDVSDAIYTLSFLFQGGPAPPSPFPACGPDPRSDSLVCDSLPSCGR